MEGLIRYLLLNPGGEPYNTYQSARELMYWCIVAGADADQHNTFFMGHIAFISSQDVLKILIRQSDEASVYADDMRDIL